MVTLVAEVGEFSRFKNTAQLMAYADLVPSESSSGPRNRRGSITKAGNSHLRWIVIESAWHYRHRPKVGYQLKKRAGAAAARRTRVNYSVLEAFSLNSRPETEAAPDGSRSCGNQPAYINLINRRHAGPAFS